MIAMMIVRNYQALYVIEKAEWTGCTSWFLMGYDFKRKLKHSSRLPELEPQNVRDAIKNEGLGMERWRSG